MEIRPLETASGLSALLRRSPVQPFLQSWAWGDFQKAYGRRIWRLGAFDAGQLVGAVTLMAHQLVLGKRYLYAPHGPVADRLEAWLALAAAAADLGRRESAMYVKLDVPLHRFPIPSVVPGFEFGTSLQPRHTLILDLDREEASILASMHQKTRYNIRLAEKHGVTVRWSTTDEDHERYLILQKEMAQRQNISLHPDQYYRTMFDTLRSAGMGELAIAECDGQALAINLIIWHEDTAVFNHGGSTQERKEVMAPYLLQWASISEAKRRGKKSYDFRGIAPEGEHEHKLAGVTRFKLGFGGRRVVYPESRNAILDRPWWMAYRLAKRMRGGVEE